MWGQGEGASGHSPGEESLSIKKRVRSLERDLIQKALENTGGNRAKAAQVLEISYPSLLRKIKDYDLS
jgi:two-component system response regulator AtoC